jgi:hypothetical protein
MAATAERGCKTGPVAAIAERVDVLGVDVDVAEWVSSDTSVQEVSSFDHFVTQ